MTARILPRQCFGTIVMTAAVAHSVPTEIIASLLRRHMRNDWGDLDPEDSALNEEAVALCDGSRVMSSYKDAFKETIWIISYIRDDGLMANADFCNTTVLFPSDY